MVYARREGGGREKNTSVSGRLQFGIFLFRLDGFEICRFLSREDGRMCIGVSGREEDSKI